MCPQPKSTYVRIARETEIFFCLFCVLRHTKHEHSSKGEILFFTHAIIILSLFTYSVCDEKVKKKTGERKGLKKTERKGRELCWIISEQLPRQKQLSLLSHAMSFLCRAVRARHASKFSTFYSKRFFLNLIKMLVIIDTLRVF